MLNPGSSGSPEHVGSGGSGDAHTDNNHNLLTSSLYLSLGAVQAAAAAAFVHPHLSTTGNNESIYKKNCLIRLTKHSKLTARVI